MSEHAEDDFLTTVVTMERRNRSVQLYEARMARVAALQYEEMMASGGAISIESRRLSRRWMRAFRKAEATGERFTPVMVGTIVVDRMRH